jgi:hypothetical protein
MTGPAEREQVLAKLREIFFVPPYVGHRGWIGARLDRGIPWDELAGIVEDAYAESPPRSWSRPPASVVRNCAY